MVLERTLRGSSTLTERGPFRPRLLRETIPLLYSCIIVSDYVIYFKCKNTH